MYHIAHYLAVSLLFGSLKSLIFAQPSGLVKPGKDSSYLMVDKLLRLLLTLPVSIATI
jgi:hypothetical protein